MLVRWQQLQEGCGGTQFVGTSLAWYNSRDCRVCITCQHFLPGLVCYSLVLSSARLIPAQGQSLSVNTLPSHHVPYKSKLYR